MATLEAGDWVKITNKNHPWYNRQCEELNVSLGNINLRTLTPEVTYDVQLIEAQFGGDTIETVNGSEIILIK